jgi:autotransporter-associated beta strand protein
MQGRQRSVVPLPELRYEANTLATLVDLNQLAILLSVVLLIGSFDLKCSAIADPKVRAAVWAGRLEISGGISGAFSLTKSDGGRLRFVGTAKTYSGDTIITGSKDNTCRIWKDQYALKGLKKPVAST